MPPTFGKTENTLLYDLAFRAGLVSAEDRDEATSRPEPKPAPAAKPAAKSKTAAKTTGAAK